MQTVSILIRNGAVAIVIILAAAELTGCAGHGPLEPWTPPDTSARLRADLTGSRQDPSGQGSASDNHLFMRHTRAPGHTVDLAKSAGPKTYVRLALQRSPAIAAARHRVAATAARIDQVTSLADPVFSVAPVGEMAQTATGQVGLMTSLSQKLPWPDKLDTKGKIAKAAVAGAKAHLRQVMLRVAAQTRKAYWQLYGAARSLKQLKQIEPLLTILKQTAQAQLRGGRGDQSDVLRASVEISDLRRKQATFKKQRATATAMLNRLLNRPANAPIPDPPKEAGGLLRSAQVNLEKSRLLAEAAEHNPAIAGAQARIAASNQRIHLSKLAPIPDLKVGVHYNAVDDWGVVGSPSGEDQWWLSFGITLPIWNGKYDAMQSEALARALESSSQLQNARQQVNFAVQSALYEVNNQQTQLHLFHKRILPQARQAAKDALADYRSTSGSFTDALDAWRRLLTLQLTAVQNRSALGKALADLRQAVGEDLGHTSRDREGAETISHRDHRDSN